MKKLFALMLSIAMVVSMFSGIAFAAVDDYAVTFDGSNQAGATSKLQFAITKDAVTTIVIDFGETGFVPVGAATMADVAQTTNIVGNVATITIAPTNNPTIKLPVRNPLVAKNILAGAGITVTFNGDTGSATTDLSVKYTVTPSVTSPVLGGTSTVSFNVTQAGNLVTDTLVYKIYKGAVDNPLNLLTTGTTSTGSFTAAISFSADANVYAQDYNVVVERGSDSTINGSAVMTARYNLTVEGHDGAKYLDARTLTGRLTKADGTGIANAPVSLVNKSDANSLVASATTAADGSFAMTAVFADAAVFAFRVGAVEYSSFTVGGLGLTVTAAPASVVKTLGTTAMTFTVKLPGTDTTPTAGDPEIRILNPDGTVRVAWTTTLTWTAPADLPTGTYTVEARWEATAGGITTAVYDRTGSTTFVVSNPSKLNVTYAPTTHVDNVLTVGNNGVAITIRDVAGDGFTGSAATASQIKKVVISVTGPLTSAVTIDTSVTAPVSGTAPWSADLRTVTPTFNIEQAGDIVITGTVTFGDNSTETFTKTYKNNGWAVTTEKVLGTVGDVVTLRAVVTTASGTPVNNAIVTWATGDADTFYTVKATDGTWGTGATFVTVNGSTTNINNGVYEKEVKLNKVGNVDVTVTTTAPENRAAVAASITGQSVYTVTPSVTSLIATLSSQTLRLTITDENGAKLTNVQTLDITGSTGVLAAPLSIANTTMFDANADGIVDGYQFSVSPLATGTLTITAKTHGGNKLGTATVSVVAPDVTVSLGTKVTENVTEKLNVKVNDLTGTPAVARTINLKVTAVGANMELKTDVATPGILTDGSAPNQTHTVAAASAEHKLLVTAWDEVEATPVAPLVRIEVSYNGTNYVKVADLAVTPLNIALNTDEVYVGGVNKVEATITDAHGAPYVGKAVTLAQSTGSTNADGMVTLSISPSGTGTATLSVATSRNNVFATKKITITADTIKPELEITSALNVTMAHYVLKGAFSDNLGVTQIFVNGAQIPFIAALGEFEFHTTLVLGTNTFTVFAFDAAGNGTKETVVVNYARPIPIVITLGQANPSIGLDVAPALVSGRTMVPFRWFGERVLGIATENITWNEANGSVTMIHGGTTVILTINSRTASVNGQAVQLDAAPFITGGRTLVPARFLAETFGFTITWDSVTNNVTIVKN